MGLKVKVLNVALLDSSMLFMLFHRYIPLDWVSKKELTVDEVRKLNQYNTDVVKALLQHTTMYTVYQHGNFTCIALKYVCKLRNEL